MINSSLWLDGIDNCVCEQLNNDINVDVLIIGGGLTGISTAYHLIDSKLKVALVDKDIVGHGVTSRTTGKLTYLQELIYLKLNKIFDFSIVKMYLNSQIDAINIVKDIINKNKIKCDYEEVSSYIFTKNSNEIKLIKKEKSILESLGITVLEYNNLPVDKIYSKYAISVNNTAVFHPIKYLIKLKKVCLNNSISIYEHTKVLSINKDGEKYVCITEHGRINCSKIVLACHYPFFLLPMFFPLKGHLERSYLSASIVKNNKKLSAINTSVCSKSLRYHSDQNNEYFIYLNGSHVIDSKNDEDKNFKKLRKDVENLGIIPKYMWSNQDIITNDYLPYIGCIKQGDNSFLIGTGYNTWGMTNASLAGKILSDMVMELENKYIPLFDPNRRKKIYSILSIPSNFYYSIKPFFQNKILKNKSWYSKNVKIKTIHGNSIAIYKDEKGIKHMVYNKCPHMKCSLIFNEYEKTWDCPCHGSRFSIDGKCIHGPSNYDISYKK